MGTHNSDMHGCPEYCQLEKPMPGDSGSSFFPAPCMFVTALALHVQTCHRHGVKIQLADASSSQGNVGLIIIIILYEDTLSGEELILTKLEARVSPEKSQ